MIYSHFHISKQAVSQYEQRSLLRMNYYQDLLEQVRIERKAHPRMGARVLYFKLNPEKIGRVRYESLLLKNGFRLRKLKNYFRTTDSSWVRFKNLIAGVTLNDINQVWVSDITYYLIAQQVYYITTIMDLYSRRILGYSISERMFAEDSSMKCLRMSLRLRRVNFFNQLIHHSDRGSQYRFKPYVDLLQSKGARISMCKNVYDNAHMERLNGTIKNDYLIPLGVESLRLLKHMLPVVIKRYNDERPHSSLNKMTPLAFEQYILTISLAKRPKTKIKPELSTIPRY